MTRRISAVTLFALLAFQLGSPDPGTTTSALHADDISGGISNLVTDSTDDLEALRRSLVELTAARAARLSADELRIAIAAAENDTGKLPPAAREILGSLQSQAAEIQADANRKIASRKRDTIADLKVLMVKFTRDGQLDQAVAVRDLIRALRMPMVTANADPGSMSGHSNRIGKSFHFRVTGRTTGSVYGTNIYTSDSTLAAAAVHAGVLRNGQTGIVKVTMMRGQATYQASVRNGVSTYSYSAYPTSYRVEAVPLDGPFPKQQVLNEEETGPRPKDPAIVEPKPDAAEGAEPDAP